MRLALAVAVSGCLCACGGAEPVAIANRGGTASVSCEVPARIELEARRYANLDHDDADYNVWTAWRVGIQLADRAKPKGTMAMVGDAITWTFDVAGKLDAAKCVLTLWTPNEHEPFDVVLDVGKHTGTIRSIDDVWLLGPPFPTKRP